MERHLAASPSADDEEFWRRNERYFTQRMGQPSCTLAGTSLILSQLKGDFAVVVHGEADCLNNFPHIQGGSLHRFYCTRLSQRDFASGNADPLRECLEVLIATRAPKVVFVLGTCLTEMSRSDYPAVAAEVSARSGVPIVALRTSGLKIVSQAGYTDSFFLELASLSAGGVQPEPGLINLVGLPPLASPERRELQQVLGEAGLRLACSYPLEASLEDWLALGRAGANVIVDLTLYPRLSGRLKASQACLDAPLPVGLAQTAAFYRAIGRGLGRQEAMERAVLPREARAREGVEAFRSRYGGLRVAVGVRMFNFSGPSQLALDGLAELPAFAELGFEVSLLVQGPPDLTARRYFQERLATLGGDVPSYIFAEPDELPEHLGSGRFDMAYMGDHAREYARRAGIPFVFTQSLRPMLSGVTDNLEALERALRGRGRVGTGAR